MEDLYRTLDLPHDATPEQIKDRFLFLAQAYHPDKFRSSEHKAKAEQQFKKISEVYETLSDSKKRAEYDRRLRNLSQTPHYQAYPSDKAKPGQTGKQHDNRKKPTQGASNVEPQDEPIRVAYLQADYEKVMRSLTKRYLLPNVAIFSTIAILIWLFIEKDRSFSGLPFLAAIVAMTIIVYVVVQRIRLAFIRVQIDNVQSK